MNALNIGNDYYSGNNGKDRDYSEALKWYRKAAEQGISSAQYNLGRMYEKGRGVLKDKNEALKWYKQAAEKGNADAQKALQRLQK